MLNQTGPLGTVASEYDIAGRRTKLTWPDTFHVTYDHLVTGETIAIRENGAASGIGVIGTLAYDDLGRRTSLTLGNGLATLYQYDPVSRLGELKLELPGTANDLISAFTYNPASQIASNTRSNDAYAWTGHGSGTTAAVSNGIAQSANGLNQIGSWVSALGYDARGNITSDGAYSYGYSSENLLTSLTNPTPGAIQAWSTYAYDPLMRLAVINSSNDALDASLGYDGQDFIVEGLSGNRTRRYVRGPGVDEPLVAYLVTPTGTSRLWYQADERGSITRLSNDSGTPGQIGKYDEYGVGGTGRIRYAGQYWLGDGNLLYSRARIYDSRLGRFLQPDPIGFGGGINLYAYVEGDPVNFTDPLGLDGESLGQAIVTGPKEELPSYIYARLTEDNRLVKIASTTTLDGLIFADDDHRRNYQPKCPSVPASRPVGTTGLAGVALRDPTGVMIAGDVRSLANEASRLRFSSLSSTGTARDAFRHFYGAFALTRLIGPSRALKILNAVEVSGANSASDRDMDTFNNHVALQMAQDPQNLGRSTADLANTALAEGCLKINH